MGCAIFIFELDCMSRGNKMNRRLIMWGVPLLLYLAFAGWYTGFGGALKSQEVEALVGDLKTGGADQETIARMRKFMEEDTGRQIFIINALDMAEDPVLPEGAAEGASAVDLMNHYMEHMFPALFKRASHPIFFGVAVSSAVDLVGVEDEAGRWEQGAIFRYRSRRDMLEIATNPAFRERHDYKIAALEKTIAYPTEAGFYLGDPRLLLFLILGFATALLDILIYGRRK
jgi:hypothetical protein